MCPAPMSSSLGSLPARGLWLRTWMFRVSWSRAWGTGSVWKRVGTGGLRLLSLQRPADKAGLGWHLGTSLVNSVLQSYESFPKWSRGLAVSRLCRPHGRCLCDQTSGKIWLRCTSLEDSTWHVLLRLAAEGIKHIPCYPQGETLSFSKFIYF